MRHGVGVLVVLSVPLLLVSACGPLTQMLFAKQEAEIDVRFLGVERRVDEHDAELTTLGIRVTGLETSVTQTADVARGARDRADVALARTAALDRRLTPPATPRAVPDPSKARALLGTVQLRFAFDRSDLDEGAEKALASVLKELRQNPGLTVDLEGSTDATGTRDYNLQLSRRRVEVVRRYLLVRGVEARRIMHSSGVGALRDGGMPEEHKRRVVVKLMKPSE